MSHSCNDLVHGNCWYVGLRGPVLAQVSTHDIGASQGVLSLAVRLAGRAVEVAVQSIRAGVGPHFAVGFRCRGVLHAGIAGLARGYELFS